MLAGFVSNEAAQESSLEQVFYIVNLAGSAVLFVNNFLVFNMKQSVASDLRYNISALDEALLLISTVCVLFFSISTPFDDKRVNSQFSSTLYFIAVFYITTSVPVSDPSIIFQSTNELLYDFVQQIDRNITLDNVELLDVFERDVSGLWFLYVVNVARFAMFIIALATAVWVNYTQIKALRVYWESAIQRGALGGLGVWGVYVYLSYVGESYDYDARMKGFRNFKDTELFLETNGFNKYWMKPEVNILLKDMIVSVLGIFSLFSLVFYENYTLAVAPLTIILVNALIILDANGIDGTEFTFTLWALIGLVCTIMAYLVSRLIRNESSVRDITQLAPSLTYKAGHLLNLLSVVFLIIGYYNTWLEVDFKPVAFQSDILDALRNMQLNLDTVIIQMEDLITVLDPCYVRSAEVEDTDTGEMVSFEIRTTTDLRHALNEQRLQAYNDGDEQVDERCVDTNTGVLTSDYYEEGSQCRYLITYKRVCCLMEKAEEDTIREFESQAINGILPYDTYPEGYGPVTTSDFDIEGYVNPVCRDIQCTVVTVITAIAAILSFIPFIGKIGYIMGLAARVAFRIFKFGRRLIGYIPRIRKHKKKIKRMVARIKKLMVATSRTIRFSRNLAILFAPVLLSAAITITLITLKRKLNTKSTGVIARAQTAILAFTALSLPILLTEIVFYTVLSQYTHTVEEILDALPEKYIASSMREGVGYACMKYAYAISIAGNVITTASYLMFVFNIVFEFIVENIIAYLRYVFFIPRSMHTEALVTYNVRALSLQIRYLHPLLFSVPVYFLFSSARTYEYDYVTMRYEANQQVVATRDEIYETFAQKDRYDIIGLDIEDMECGVTGKALVAAIKAISSVFDALRDKLNIFNLSLFSLSDVAQQFIDSLADLLDFTTMRIDIFGDFHNTRYYIIYGIPLMCTTTLALAWVFAFLFGDSARTQKIYTSLIIFVASLSIVNVVVNMMITELIVSITGGEFPYVQVVFTMGAAYYGTLGASTLNLLSVVAFYVNHMIDVE